jgi:CRISPR-associated protein Csy1
LLQYAAEIHELEGGWSAAEGCKLVNAERLWLDPKRAETDEAFAVEWRRGDWQDDICRRFADWLNRALRSDKLLMGQPEALALQSVLDDELRMIRLEF